MKREDKRRLKRLREMAEVGELTRMRCDYLWLKEMEFDLRIRNKALRLAKKRRKQADSFVV